MPAAVPRTNGGRTLYRPKSGPRQLRRRRYPDNSPKIPVTPTGAIRQRLDKHSRAFSSMKSLQLLLSNHSAHPKFFNICLTSLNCTTAVPALESPEAGGGARFTCHRTKLSLVNCNGVQGSVFPRDGETKGASTCAILAAASLAAFAIACSSADAFASA